MCRTRLGWAVLVGGLWLSQAVCLAGEWLTPFERDFFLALGVDAVVNDRTIKRTADVTALPNIAGRAEPPLRGRIQALEVALKNMAVTDAEKATYQRLLREGQAQVQQMILGAFLRGLAGDNPREPVVDATDALMRNVHVVEAWQLQRKWLERGLDARAAADARFAEIVAELARRSGSRPAADATWTLAVDGEDLTVRVTAKTALGTPLVQLVVWKQPSSGAWTGLNEVAGLFLQALGVSAMNARSQVEGARLAAAQEQAMNLPWVTTALLPTLDRGQTAVIRLRLPVTVALGIDHVEARLWSAEGSTVLPSISGLPAAQDKATSVMAARRLASQISSPGSTGRVTPRVVRASAPRPAEAADSFYSGSVWRGTSQHTSPKGMQQQVELVVTDRKGDDFMADYYVNNHLARKIRGTASNVAIQWQDAPQPAKPGYPAKGKLLDDTIVATFRGYQVLVGTVQGQVRLEYVPPVK
jgi:hypothetical protein